MKIYLPKISNTGPAPCMIINSKVKSLINLRDYQNKDNLASDILTNLYIDRKFSQQKIAKIFNVQHDTVRRWLDRLNIPVRNRKDAVSIALTKYHKELFSGDLKEKAYLLGLRTGDISAQRHGRSIRIHVGSTHPAMLELFKSTFSSYGKIGTYPKFSAKNKISRFPDYKWSIYCDTDKSFRFMLNKPKSIPRWVMENDNLFYSFLSGYFDAEGCISISYKYGNGSSLVWIIKSSGEIILRNIHDILKERGFSINMNLVKEADGIEYNHDYWSIIVCTKKQVLKLLGNINLRHEEKIMKHRLALELINTNWKDANKKIVELRQTIKADVKKCVESAKKEYIKRRCNNNTSYNSFSSL